jgi:hypothetical protein
MDIPEQGLYTHLKGFDFIKVFRTVDQDDHVRHYGIYLMDSEQLRALDKEKDSKTLKSSIGRSNRCSGL